MLRNLLRLPVALLLFLSACGAAPIKPASIPAGGLEVPPPHRAAVEEIVTIMRSEMALPLPERVSVFVYDSRAAFREGLMDEGYVATGRVNEIASFAAGLARPGRVLLHAKATRGPLEWRRLIAHELTHVVQFNLAGGDGRADQWLAEGVAERIAFDVLERLGLDSVGERRARALSGARKYPGFAAGRLDLVALGSPREFTLRHQRDGSLETYQLSFLMADYLVKRDGLTTVLEYFRNCRVMDRDHAFARAFGQSIPQFEKEVLAYLRGLGEQLGSACCLTCTSRRSWIASLR